MVPWWRPQSYYDDPGRGVLARDGGGVLITQAIHSLDLFRWLLGIERVEAAQVRTTALHRMETEDYAAALLRLGNGAPGTIIATVAAYPGSPGVAAHHRQPRHGAGWTAATCAWRSSTGGRMCSPTAPAPAAAPA